MDPFKSVYRGDFIWPYIAPLILVPGQPPVYDDLPTAKPEAALEPCKCDRHSWSPHFQRAEYLKQKEDSFREAMIFAAKERTILENEIIEHPCTDSDSVLSSLYQINYDKRAFPVTGYRAMKSDHDDPTINPVPMIKSADKSIYRDPTVFRQYAIETPYIGVPPPVSFERAPPSSSFEPTMTTEYKETYDMTAISTLNSSQQFKEPTPSSRKRLGCLCY